MHRRRFDTQCWCTSDSAHKLALSRVCMIEPALPSCQGAGEDRRGTCVFGAVHAATKQTVSTGMRAEYLQVAGKWLLAKPCPGIAKKTLPKRASAAYCPQVLCNKAAKERYYWLVGGSASCNDERADASPPTFERRRLSTARLIPADRSARSLYWVRRAQIITGACLGLVARKYCVSNTGTCTFLGASLGEIPHCRYPLVIRAVGVIAP
jgi:hypothetical protein